MDLLEQFEEAGHDGRDLRPLALWSWNDRLDPEEVRRQVREMAKAGLGGHFMQARRGCETPYLGPGWLEAVHAAVDEARHTGVRPWLCDEDGSPSGTCSGRIYAGSEPLQAKDLVYEEVGPSSFEPSERTVAVFLARRDPATFYRDLERLDDPRRACGMALGPDRVLLAFTYRTEAYVDTLSRGAADEFLKRTHEVYRQAVGREFGRLVPGIRTDEPVVGRPGHRLPWSAELPRFFQRSTGYALADHLPELFFPVGPYRKTRFDFYESLTRLFLLAWTMPLFQWCARSGLALTGHLPAEETLAGQVGAVGAVMPQYEYMHIPGIEHSGREPGGPVPIKQAASVAAQLGRPGVLAGLFAGAGWNAGLDDLRHVAEWHIVLGATRLCQHRSALSLRGERKRDFPPSLHSHQPWWPHAYLWNDYAARLLAALAAGEAVADVLVVHPIASAWAEYSPLDHAAVDDLDRGLRHLADALLAMHADFHFGDELILERHASVEKGALVVGRCRYRAVLVPDATNLRRSTLDLLGRFRRSGGTVLFTGRVPSHVGGEPSAEPLRLARQCRRLDARTRAGRSALKRALKPALEVCVSGSPRRGRSIRAASEASGAVQQGGAASILAQWRRDGRDQIFFFVNVGARPVKAVLALPGTGRLLRLDPATGRAEPVEAASRGGRTVLDHAFAPRASALYLLRPDGDRGQEGRARRDDAAASPAGADLPHEPPRRRKVLGGRWHVRRRDPNVLVLDTASWRPDEGEYSPPMHILDVQQTLLRSGADEMIRLRFQFDCGLRDLKGRRLELVLEQPHAWELWFGGMRTPLTDLGPYWDTALRRVDVTPCVRRGRNIVELRRPWHVSPARRALLLGLTAGWESRTLTAETELEAVYLVGDFAVAFPRGSSKGSGGSRWMRGAGRLVEESPVTTGGDLVRAGYPFFAGRLGLVRDVVLKEEPSPWAVLELPPFRAVTATVEVNGQEAGTIWQAPRTVAVGELLRRGSNRIAITLATSLRNLLGPHHHAEGELAMVPPSAFAGATGWFGRAPSFNRLYRPDYNLVDFGLGGTPILRY